MTELTTRNLHKPEILAPAGTFEALRAAVSAGADAVYLGGDLFSARAFAGNFGTEELVEAIRFCHLFDVRVYLTVNTLFKSSEIAQLPAYLQPFYEAGADAVLVQDIGAAQLLHREYPLLPLHASTQMSISSRFGARFLKTLGFTRIVPARELSLEEIRSIKAHADIEIETFVHGAMCFAYSGKCLLSSFMGGRSGNRGRCAQPCRQCYEVTGAVSGAEYALSLKDMCALSILPELIEAGIDSFKIEGRMKNPAYVYAVTKAYVTARDLYFSMTDTLKTGKPFVGRSDTAKAEYTATAEILQKQLMDIYNRGGFCTGYYHAYKGSDGVAAGENGKTGITGPGTPSGRHMAASERPNHDGIRVGTVEKKTGPDLLIRLSEEVHPQDVLEIRDRDTEADHTGLKKTISASRGCIAELTCNTNGRSGERIRIKGNHLKQIRPGMPVFRTRNQMLLSRIEEERLQERTVCVDAFVQARLGKPLTITFEEGKKEQECFATGQSPSEQGVSAIKQSRAGSEPGRVCVTVCGSEVQPAGTKPVTQEQLLEKLGKTGGSNLEIRAEVELDDNVFVSMSEFNRLRREAAEAFKKAKAERHCRR